MDLGGQRGDGRMRNLDSTSTKAAPTPINIPFPHPYWPPCIQKGSQPAVHPGAPGGAAVAHRWKNCPPLFRPVRPRCSTSPDNHAASKSCQEEQSPVEPHAGGRRRGGRCRRQHERPAAQCQEPGGSGGSQPPGALWGNASDAWYTEQKARGPSAQSWEGSGGTEEGAQGQQGQT